MQEVLHEWARAEAGKWVDTLEKRRVDLGIPKKQLADAVGVSVPVLANWRKGRRLPELPSLLLFGREVEMRMELVKAGDVVTVEQWPPPEVSWERAEAFRLVRTLRAVREGTQEELARRIGMSAWSLCRFETGTDTPRSGTLAAWAKSARCRWIWTPLD